MEKSKQMGKEWVRCLVAVLFGMLLGSPVLLAGCELKDEYDCPDPDWECDACLTPKDLRAVEERLARLESRADELEDETEELDRSVDYNSKKIAVWKEHVVTWKDAMCKLSGKCIEVEKKETCPPHPVKYKPVYPGDENYE